MTIDKRLLAFLTVGFILATVMGTLTHECGHYLVAKSLGYDAKINYAFTHWTKSNPDQAINTSDNLWITLGGPLETMLTGTFGLTLLFLLRKSFQPTQKLSFGQWSVIFISLFWLRQTANYIVWLGDYFFSGQFSNRSDEIKLARQLQLPDWIISAPTATIGAIVLTTIIFKFIPTKQRLTFILSGLIGGVTGYILWLRLPGRMIMP